MTGSAGQQRVPTVFLYLHKIPIPTIIEQQKIVTILGTLDALIEKTDRIITRSEELKKGLIYELLTKGIRHTEFEEKELGILPKEWKCVSLVEISLSYKNGIYKLDKYYGSGHPCIRMYNIANGKVNKNNSPLLNVTDAELKEYGLVEGDLLINRVNSRDLVGKAGIVPPGLGSVTFESKNIRVRFNRSKIIPEYMGIYVQMKSYLNQVNKYVKSAISQATINQDDIDDILVPLPSVDEQKEIVTIISGLDDKINNEMRCLEHLLSIKKALMQDLLTGRVRVKPDPSPPEAAPHV
jgi:type I restriction enzyme S subunit